MAHKGLKDGYEDVIGCSLHRPFCPVLPFPAFYAVLSPLRSYVKNDPCEEALVIFLDFQIMIRWVFNFNSYVMAC